MCDCDYSHSQRLAVSPCCVEHQDESIFERVAVAYSKDYYEVGRAQIKCLYCCFLEKYCNADDHIQLV